MERSGKACFGGGGITISNPEGERVDAEEGPLVPGKGVAQGEEGAGRRVEYNRPEAWIGLSSAEDRPIRRVECNNPLTVCGVGEIQDACEEIEVGS